MIALLSPEHLAGCDLNNQGRSAADITARLQARGGRMIWWIACRSVLAELRSDVLRDFPPHSLVSTQQEAWEHILNSDWLQHISVAVPTRVAAEITTRLVAAHASAQSALGNGKYLVEFPGKDLLRDLISAFDVEFRFDLPLDALAKLKTVEARVSSRNNAEP
jgi:hypothetical protein